MIALPMALCSSARAIERRHGILEGQVLKLDAAAEAVAVKLAGGTEHSLHVVMRTTVHGAPDTVAATRNAFHGLKGGSHVGNASRNLFRSPAYDNLDFSVSKIWKIRERYSAQFRAEFFNLFNRTDFAVPPSKASDAGLTGQFGCSCSTPDVSNPVFGSGGPRHIQFGLKLTY